MPNVDIGGKPQSLAGHMRRRTDARGGEGQRAGFRLGRGDQIGDGLETALLGSDQHVGLNAQHRDPDEILHRIVRQAAMQNHAGAERSRAGDQCVAVRIGLGDVGKSDDAAGARLGLDHHRLAEELRDAVEHDAADGVGGASGRERADDPDRPGWPIVGLRGCRGNKDCGAEGGS